MPQAGERCVSFSGPVVPSASTHTAPLPADVCKTIDFVDDRGTMVFRTHAKEKGHVVLQLGSSNAQRALKAATIACVPWALAAG